MATQKTLSRRCMHPSSRSELHLETLAHGSLAMARATGVHRVSLLKALAGLPLRSDLAARLEAFVSERPSCVRVLPKEGAA